MESCRVLPRVLTDEEIRINGVCYLYNWVQQGNKCWYVGHKCWYVSGMRMLIPLEIQLLSRTPNLSLCSWLFTTWSPMPFRLSITQSLLLGAIFTYALDENVFMYSQFMYSQLFTYLQLFISRLSRTQNPSLIEIPYYLIVTISVRACKISTQLDVVK